MAEAYSTGISGVVTDIESWLSRVVGAINDSNVVGSQPDVIDPVDLYPEDEQTTQGIQAFAVGEQDSLVDPMTSTAQERKLAEKTFAQQTPGSAGSFQSAQAATMQSPKSWFQEWGGGDSGDLSGFIPTKALAPVEGGVHFMKPDAAKAYKAMQRAAKKNGIDFSVTDSYRDYEAQVRLKKEKPTLAATPGHSNHGWGLALDINVNDSATYNWLRKHGKRFGFEQPMSYEPWHWEYHGGYAAKPKPTGKPRRSGVKPKPSDPLSRVSNVSSFITAPHVFGSVVREIENVPVDMDGWAQREKQAKLEWVPARYRNLVREAADRTGLPARLIALVIQKESSFNPKAVSSAGAQGLMQIMPLHNLGQPFNARKNVMFGANLLSNYIEQMGSLRLGLAAYNAGPNNHEAGLGYADSLLAEFRGEA